MCIGVKNLFARCRSIYRQWIWKPPNSYAIKIRNVVHRILWYISVISIVGLRRDILFGEDLCPKWLKLKMLPYKYVVILVFWIFYEKHFNLCIIKSHTTLCKYVCDYLYNLLVRVMNCSLYLRLHPKFNSYTICFWVINNNFMKFISFVLVVSDFLIIVSIISVRVFLPHQWGFFKKHHFLSILK